MFEYLFAFFPMLSGYLFHGIGLDLIAMAVMSLIILRNQSGKIKIGKNSRDFLYLFAYVVAKDILIALIGESNISESFHRLLSNVSYIVFFLILLKKNFNQDRFYKGLNISGTLYTLGLVYHLVLIYVFGMPAKGISIIPGYEFTNVNWLNRPRSFFSEPAALAQAMLPLLFYSLHKQDYRWSLIATFTIFMSSSTTGVLLAAVLWGIEFILVEGNKSRKVLVIIAFLMASVLLFRTEMAMDTLSFVKLRLAGGGSTSVRVFLGFEILKTMKPTQFIIGLFYNKAYDFAAQNIGLFATNSIVRGLVGLGESQFFVNAFATLIFRYGIIGAFLYFRVYKGKVFNKAFAGRAFAIMTLIEMIGDTMLFNAYYFYIMLILHYIEQEKDGILQNGTAK